MATILLSFCATRSTGIAASATHVVRRAIPRCSGVLFSSASDDNTSRNDDNLQSTPLGGISQTQTLQPGGGESLQQPKQTRRRTRRRTLQSSVDNDRAEPIPSLADFMHRGKVLKQYRNFMRLAQFVDGKDNGGVTSGGCRVALEEVRVSFKLGMKKDVDALSKNMAYAEGERRLREIQAMVGYSTSKQSNQSNLMSEGSYDADSWINIKDEEDPRGRVGVQWPWEQDNDQSK
mmetsp:Transcript_37998/g.81977  ORF Transcript_37998/g.81977 Transcript_37998/m.81977 type:complete len:233 (-) Transcript_37998:59-757(-)